MGDTKIAMLGLRKFSSNSLGKQSGKQWFNPNYALGMHSLPDGLTKKLISNVLTWLKPDNENHQLGFRINKISY